MKTDKPSYTEILKSSGRDNRGTGEWRRGDDSGRSDDSGRGRGRGRSDDSGRGRGRGRGRSDDSGRGSGRGRSDDSGRGRDSGRDNKGTGDSGRGRDIGRGRDVKENHLKDSKTTHTIPPTVPISEIISDITEVHDGTDWVTYLDNKYDTIQPSKYTVDNANLSKFWVEYAVGDVVITYLKWTDKEHGSFYKNISIVTSSHVKYTKEEFTNAPDLNMFMLEYSKLYPCSMFIYSYKVLDITECIVCVGTCPIVYVEVYDLLNTKYNCVSINNLIKYSYNTGNVVFMYSWWLHNNIGHTEYLLENVVHTKDIRKDVFTNMSPKDLWGFFNAIWGCLGGWISKNSTKPNRVSDTIMILCSYGAKQDIYRRIHACINDMYTISEDYFNRRQSTFTSNGKEYVPVSSVSIDEPMVMYYITTSEFVKDCPKTPDELRTAIDTYYNVLQKKRDAKWGVSNGK